MSHETLTPANDGAVRPVERRTSRIALRFVLLIGILSFFADFTYEGLPQDSRAVPRGSAGERRSCGRRQQV